MGAYFFHQVKRNEGYHYRLDLHFAANGEPYWSVSVPVQADALGSNSWRLIRLTLRSVKMSFSHTLPSMLG